MIMPKADQARFSISLYRQYATSTMVLGLFQADNHPENAYQVEIQADRCRNCTSDRGTLIVWSSLYMLQIGTGSCVRERIVSAAMVDSLRMEKARLELGVPLPQVSVFSEALLFLDTGPSKT
jgi:hypothetical protein